MKIACLSGKGGAGKTFVAVNLAYAAGEATYIDCDVEEPNGRLFWKPKQVSRCLSGKGGAGKTFVAVNLAYAAGEATYIDCDVEEPNGRLFWKPKQVSRQTVSKLLPEFDAEKCTGCKACVQFCRFHALMYIREKPMVFPEVCHSCGGCQLVCPTGAISEKPKPIGCVQFCRFHALMYIREKPMVFPEVCHSCGGCQLVCPTGAISEKPKPIGILETGRSGQVQVISGILNPGEASGVPLIRRALQEATGLSVLDCPPGSACSVMETVQAADVCLLVAEPTTFGLPLIRRALQEATGLSVLDCPPGSACSVMETVQAADVCLLVAEPTTFGFHNFQMVHELCTLLKKPCAVVINKQSSPSSTSRAALTSPWRTTARPTACPFWPGFPMTGSWRNGRPRESSFLPSVRIFGICSETCSPRQEGWYEAAFDSQRKGWHGKDHHGGGLPPLFPGPGGCGLRRGCPQPALVDAPNLHLMLHPQGQPQRSAFLGGDKAAVDTNRCTGCGECLRHCRFSALTLEQGVCRVNPYACEGCGVCAYVCPEQAVALHQDVAGEKELYAEAGRSVFSTATLKMGRGNSGKLVTEVKLAMLKNRASPSGRHFWAEIRRRLTPIDAPAVGCACAIADFRR